MITNYESFLGNNKIYELSENICPSVNISSFKSLFESKLFESSNDSLLLEKMYATYELGVLYENRKSWFETDTPIYMLEGAEHKILFKENSMFILSNSSYAVLNEQLEDGWNWLANQTASAIKSVKSQTDAAVNAVASASKETWNALSDGAQKVYEFGKKIVSAVVEFAKAKPVEIAAIVLQILSVLVAFFPPVGVWLSPILLAISGALEIYEGTHNIKEAYSKLKMMGVENPKRSAEAFAVGGPLLLAGLIALLFGLNDIIIAPTAGSGVGPIASMGGKKAAQAWSKSFMGTAIHGFEHFAEHSLGRVTTKLSSVAPGFTKFIVEEGSKSAPAIISLLFVIVGKHVFGPAWNAIVKGLSGIAKAFSFMLGVPAKIGEAIGKFKASAESTGAQIIATALDSFVGPAMRGMGSFLNSSIKPKVDGASAWLSSIAVSYKEIEKLAETEDLSGEKIEIQNKQIKPKGAAVQKADSKNIKALPKVTSGTSKVKEGLNHITGFEDFSLV